MKEIHVGVDTGGTFTDFVVWLRSDRHKRHSERILSFKILSTPDDPSRAIIQGLERILAEHASPGAKLSPNDLEFTHGSTVATNAVLEGKGARTAFVATKGFKDVLHLARQNRPILYDLSGRRGESLLGRDDCYELSERTDSQGEVLTPLDQEGLAAIGNTIAGVGYESVAVCLLYSFLNPEHEQVIAQYLRNLPNAPEVSISSQVLPEFREYERASTTFVNAYVSPVMRKYLARLSDYIGHDHWAVFGSAGGGIRVDTARTEAVRTVLSGPAGGVTAAYYLGQKIGRTKLLTFDMGGTSTDVALINDSIPFTTEGTLRDLPVGLPMISIHTVGAGGGSLGYVDDGGALQTGPESAGANPGPVCYGNGGIQPAVSDANLILGRLPSARPLADGRSLDFEAAEQALTRLGQEAGLTQGDSNQNSLSAAQQAALGMLHIADTHMENALRHISLERGHDPRDFTLVSFGGAGGLHAAELATRLGITEVWIPAQASTFSALGMLCADFVRDFSVTVMLTAPESKVLDHHFEKLRQSSTEQMISELGSETVNAGSWASTVDVRYLGQSFEIRTDYGPDYAIEFAAKHKKLYGYTQDQELQVVNIRLRFILERPKPIFDVQPIERPEHQKLKPRTLQKSKAPGAETVSMVGGDGKIYSGPMIDLDKSYADSAGPAQKILPRTGQGGPALIVRSDTTVCVPVGWTIFEEAGNLFLRRA